MSRRQRWQLDYAKRTRNRREARARKAAKASPPWWERPERFTRHTRNAD